LALALAALLFLRAVFYMLIGAPADWTPRLNLELIVLAFRSDLFASVLMFSLLSFLRAFVVFYFWLEILAIINRPTLEAGPVQKLVRLHLGRIARWPWPIQLILSLLMVITLWIAFSPVLAHLGVVVRPHSTLHLVEQGSLVALGLILSLKYILPALLLLHLVTSYVYLGNNPFWDYVAITSTNMTAPLRHLPLRFAKLDFTPVIGVILILLALEWLPNVIMSRLVAYRMSAWPL